MKGVLWIGKNKVKTKEEKRKYRKKDAGNKQDRRPWETRGKRWSSDGRKKQGDGEGQTASKAENCGEKLAEME